MNNCPSSLVAVTDRRVLFSNGINSTKEKEKLFKKQQQLSGGPKQLDYS
ncbi:Uncharacterized protein APZ42_020628 [Daphnia magna]|uniref:Uncharacterized protein n=1 Tax=Daphnia magna TaxID=35525 RepID=A0A164X8Z9_9CRUS|nr:Uncharacterized protein APZ42_020628 [Daphnia magna]